MLNKGFKLSYTSKVFHCSWKTIPNFNKAVFNRYFLTTFGSIRKKLGAKNMQNFGLFSTTSDFDLEYLWNGARYRKWERHMISSDSSRVRRKRSGELWSTNYREFRVSLDPLKCAFGRDYISALRGCCALKFLHALQIGQALIAHTRSGTGVPPNFNRENLKFGLKFSVCIPITSGLVDISSRTFFRRHAARQRC